MCPNSKIRSTKPGATHVTGPGGQSAGDFARWYRDRSSRAWDCLPLDDVADLADRIKDARREGRWVYVIGNGGSAATASHLATDLSKTAAVSGKPRVKALSLCDNSALMTAVGNDLSFDRIFSVQLEPVLQRGDLLIIISGSGNSPNLIEAARLAKERGAFTAGLLGFDGGSLLKLVDLPILVASDQYGVIEDLHMSIGHMIAFYLKQARG